MAEYIPVDHDPFAPEASQQNARQPQYVPVDHDPFADVPDISQGGDKVAPYGIKSLVTGVPQQPKEPVTVAQDMLDTTAPGLSRGITGLAGLGGAINNGMRWIQKKVASLSEEEMVAKEREMDRKLTSYYNDLEGTPDRKLRELQPGENRNLDGNDFQKMVTAEYPSLDYHPQTRTGKYWNTAMEFAPGAVLAPGGAGAKALQTFIPAATSEAAGQATEGTAFEPYARVAGALVGGVGAARAFAPTTAEAITLKRMGNVTDEHMANAQRIMAKAQEQNIGLTLPEVIAEASGNRSTLPGLQRLVEHNPGKGAEIMRNFMADRPQQVENAGRALFDKIAPPSTSASAIGHDAGEAAQSVIGEIKNKINQQTRPLYESSGGHRIDGADFDPIARGPAFQDSLNRLRNDKILGPQYADYPDNSVKVIDAVTKDMNARGVAAGVKGEGFNPQLSERYFSEAADARDIARDPMRGGHADYGHALEQQEVGRSNLERVMATPLGKLAQRDMTTKQAIEALFPTDPFRGHSNDIANTMTKLNEKSPYIAARVIRAHAEHVFDETTQQLQTGANEFGGAKFATNLLGNPEQKATLRAAIENGMKDGPEVWKGVENLTEVLNATGKRHQAGSMTSFNTQDAKNISERGLPWEALKTGGVKLFDRLNNHYLKMRLNGDTASLAKLFTNPEAITRLRALANAPPSSTRAGMLSLRLLILANQAGKSGSSEKK